MFRSLHYMGWFYLMSYECSILNWMLCTNNEHSCNLQVWTFLKCEIWDHISIKFRSFLDHKNWTVAECFHCTDNFLCSDNIRNPNDSFCIKLWTFYEHSHLNIHTIFILNYEVTVFECQAKHSWNVPWTSPCPMGGQNDKWPSCLTRWILFTHHWSPKWLLQNTKHNGSPCTSCKGGIFIRRICGVYLFWVWKGIWHHLEIWNYERFTWYGPQGTFIPFYSKLFFWREILSQIRGIPLLLLWPRNGSSPGEHFICHPFYCQNQQHHQMNKKWCWQVSVCWWLWCIISIKTHASCRKTAPTSSGWNWKLGW